ncbi:AAA domain-containing protein [Janibacter hoylei]
MNTAQQVDPLVDKATRLFTFLAKAQRLKEKPVRDVEQYKRGGGLVRWFSDLPEHEAVRWSDSDGDPGQPLLVIDRLDKLDPPEMPTSIRTWVIGGGERCDERPSLRAHLGTGQRWDDETDSMVEVRDRLEDHPEVQRKFDHWIAAWDSWAESEMAAIPVRDSYREIFGAHVEASQNPEESELVLGLGLLAWNKEAHTPVRRHMFTLKLDVEVDARTGQLVVTGDADAVGLKAELDMLDPEAFPTRDLPRKTEDRAAQFSAAPLDRVALAELGSMTIHELDAEGRYLDEGGSHSPTATATLAWSPALILRPRAKIGLAQAFEQIAADIEQAGVVPAGLLPLVDPDQAPPTQPDPSPGALLTVGQDIFSPLPLNDVQRQILERVDRNAQTLVQGPPGTGKTHTAAALLSHLLAQGKRVLVTAHTDRALYEVRGKLPELIRPLAVSVIGASRDDMAQLRTAVDTISRNATDHDVEQTTQMIDQTLAHVEELRGERQRLNEQLLNARERETTQLSHAGYSGTLAHIAQQYEAERGQHDWVKPLLPSSSTPVEMLSNAEAAEWLDLLRDERLVTHAQQAGRRTLDANRLPAPEDFAVLADSLTSAERRQQSFRSVAEHPARTALAALQPEDRQDFRTRLQAVVRLVEDTAQLRAAWLDDAIADARMGITDVWDARYRDMVAQLQYLDVRMNFLGFETRVESTGDVNAHMQLAAALRQHLASGGQVKTNVDGSVKTGMFTPSIVKQCKPFLDAVRVNGRAPVTTDLIDRFTAHQESLWTLERMDRSWPSGTVVPPEDTLVERAAWHRAQLQTLQRVLSMRQQLNEIDGFVRDHSMPAIDWTDLAHVLEYGSVVDALGAEDEHGQARAPLSSLFEELAAVAKWCDHVDWIEPMQQAIDTNDHLAYSQAHTRAHQLVEVRRDLDRVDALTAQVATTAPLLAEAVTDDPRLPEWDQRLSRLEEAAAWAATGEWILEQEALDANEIQDQIARVEDQLQGAAESVAAMRAWNHAVGPERLSLGSRADLTQYSQLVRRLGKGTGKYAAKQRAEIRESLDRCRPSVPVWIMPIYRVVEQLRISENMFDVVLIDEASQAGLEASFLQYLAPKVVVIGDDKQVSPTAVGVDQQALRDLADQYLHDDRYKASWLDPARSLFDEALMRYGGQLTLTEHRRCVPEIIGFSNRIAYEPNGIRLVPVRQFGADRLEPIKITRTADAYEEGASGAKVNRDEARALVDALKECLEDPSYDGRTFGVISLLGTTQGKLIESMLLEEVGADEWAQRQLRVGSPAEFQGSERDVIFLSMVSSAEPGRRVAALTREMYVQRYNVAVSRARDQVWLFHTLGMRDLSSEQDMRFQLLDYAYGVMERGRDLGIGASPVVPDDERDERFDSLFEQRVYNRIVDRGFTVVPQLEAQGYRIDLVVVGAKGRLAVECDGDRWHGPDAYAADLARQRDLERCGWTFFRVRESAFYVDKAQSLEPLWQVLQDLDIRPAGELGDDDLDDFDHLDKPDALSSEAELETSPVTSVTVSSEGDDAVITRTVDGEEPPAVDDHWTSRIPESDGSTVDAAASVPPPPPAPAPLVESMVQTHAAITETHVETPTADAEELGDSGQLPAYETFTGATVPVGDATRDELIEGLVSIVSAEGPLTGERLIRCYVVASGGKRVGKLIAKELNSAVTRAERTGLIVSDNPLQEPGIKPKTFRLADQPVVSLRSLGPRTLDEVPPAELAAAMHLAERAHGAISDEDIMRITLWLFGRKSLTQTVRTRLEPVLALLRREEIGATATEGPES